MCPFKPLVYTYFIVACKPTVSASMPTRTDSPLPHDTTKIQHSRITTGQTFNLFFKLFLVSTKLVRILSTFLDQLFRKSLFHLLIHLLSHNCKGVDTKRKSNHQEKERLKYLCRLQIIIPNGTIEDSRLPLSLWCSRIFLVAFKFPNWFW